MECAPALAKIAQEAGQVRCLRCEHVGGRSRHRTFSTCCLMQEVPLFLEKAAAKGGKGKNKLWKY